MVQSLRGIDFDIYEKIAKKIWDLFDEIGDAMIDRDGMTNPDAIIDELLDNYKENFFAKADHIPLQLIETTLREMLGGAGVDYYTYLRGAFPSFLDFASYFCVVVYLENNDIDASNFVDIMCTTSSNSTRIIWKNAYAMFKADEPIEEVFKYLNAEAVAIRLNES